MVNSFVTVLVFMLAFTPALLWCLVATTHQSVVRAEGRFYFFCSASRYIRTKLHPFASPRYHSHVLSHSGAHMKQLCSILFIIVITAATTVLVQAEDTMTCTKTSAQEIA